MVKNEITKTQANILSSLHVSGVTRTGGMESVNKIPVVGADGFLDASLIPIDRVSANISIPRLSATAYVDPEAGKDESTGADIPGYVPDGSIAKPFRTVSAAAAAKDSSGHGVFSNFILTPGEYADDDVNLSTSNTIVRIIGTGTVIYGGPIGLKIRNYQPGTTVLLFNISVTATFGMLTNMPSSVVLLGRGDFGSVRGTSGDAGDALSEIFLKSVSVGPCVKVNGLQNVEGVVYITTTDDIGNASGVVGATGTAALDRLHGRKIRIPAFSTDKSGLSVSFVEVGEKDGREGESYDLFDLGSFGTSLKDAVNKTFYKSGDDLDVRDIVTRYIKATKVTAQVVSADKLVFGDIHLFLDDDGCLSVGEEQA